MICTKIFPMQFYLFHREKIFGDLVVAEKFFDLQRFAEGDKTEEPTAKKRQDARKKGQVAKSQELNTAFVLLAGFLVLKILWEYIYGNIAGYTSYLFSHMAQTTSIEGISELFLGIMALMAKTTLPIMLGIMVAALAINLYQVGFMISDEAIGFKLDKLNPINGFGRIFSKRSLVELFKSLFKILVIGFFLYLYLKDEIPYMPYFIYYDLTHSLAEIADKIFTMAFQVIAVIMVLAIADYAYQSWQTTQDLMMTKQEVKDEFKQMEGDPQVKGKRRQKQREMAMSRMMQEVPKADVIVTNPTHLAVALMYQAGMVAPVVLAKGQDLTAERIKSVARENNIPIVENKPLARALYESVEVGGSVPHELYKAVAEILAHVYKLKNKKVARSAA